MYVNITNGSELFNKQFDLNISDIVDLVESLQQYLVVGTWIFLDGDLGAGKTTISKYLSFYFFNKQIKVDSITSPTFSLYTVHEQLVSMNKKIVHIDLYRIKQINELFYLGLENEIDNDTMVIVEWPFILSIEEWNNFFNITKCFAPKCLINIEINHFDDIKLRNYQVSVMQL